MDTNTPYSIPSSWEWTELAEIADLVRVQVNPQLEPKASFNYLSIENVEPKWGDLVNFSPTIGEKIKSAKIAFTNEDILYSKLRPYLNKVHLPAFDGISATDLVPIRPVKGIAREYLALFLRTRFVVEYANLRMRGIQLPRLSVKDLLRLPVPIAPLEEQRRIASRVGSMIGAIRIAKKSLGRVNPLIVKFRRSVLEKAFRGELTERDSNDVPAIELLRRIHRDLHMRWEKAHVIGEKDPQGNTEENLSIRDSERPHLLPTGWAWTTIGAIATFIGSGITPLGGQKVYLSEGIPFIRSQNVYPDGLHLEEIAYISSEMQGQMKRSQVSPGDVLLNITGASIGRSTWVPNDFGQANVNQHVCIIRVAPPFVPAYLSTFLNSPLGQDQIFATESGVTREGLNYAQIRQLVVPVAPLNEQERLVKKFSEIFNPTNLAARAVLETTKKAEVLEESILLQAFQGRLLAQNPGDEPASVLLQKIRTERLASARKHVLLPA
jgi:type I restriction enzyme S subunit